LAIQQIKKGIESSFVRMPDLIRKPRNEPYGLVAMWLSPCSLSIGSSSDISKPESSSSLLSSKVSGINSSVSTNLSRWGIAEPSTNEFSVVCFARIMCGNLQRGFGQVPEAAKSGHSRMCCFSQSKPRPQYPKMAKSRQTPSLRLSLT